MDSSGYIYCSHIVEEESAAASNKESHSSFCGDVDPYLLKLFLDNIKNIMTKFAAIAKPATKNMIPAA